MCTIFTLYDDTTCQAVLGYKYKVMNGACGTEGKNNVALLQTYFNIKSVALRTACKFFWKVHCNNISLMSLNPLGVGYCHCKKVELWDNSADKGVKNSALQVEDS